MLAAMAAWVIDLQYQPNKAKLLQEGIFFPHPFICLRRFSNKKVGNRKN